MEYPSALPVRARLHRIVAINVPRPRPAGCLTPDAAVAPAWYRWCHPGRFAGAMVTDSPADGWLTLAEASGQLGISLDAARRRMRRGEFQRRQVRTRHGITWQVRLEPPDPGASLATTVVPTVTIEPTVRALLAYLRERDEQRDREVADVR